MKRLAAAGRSGLALYVSARGANCHARSIAPKQLLTTGQLAR
jgi:hypothetical protein